MPPYESLASGLRVLAFLIGCGAVVQLWRKGLHKQYRILFLFLAFQVVRSLSLFVASALMHTRNAYAWTWVCSEPLMWLSYILVVSDLYSLVLQNYKGLQTVGRWILFLVVPIAILISLASVLPSLKNPATDIPVVYYFDLVNRGIMFSLVIFILLILFFLSWYPITLSRNVVIHCVILTIFLISASMGYFVRNVEGGAARHGVNLAHLVITVVCWSGWLFLLTPQGGATKVMLRREWTADEEKRLVDQLTAINSSLLRAARK
jgi:hypothetical protein